MPLGINGYNDAFKAFTDFATQAKSGSTIAQVGGEKNTVAGTGPRAGRSSRRPDSTSSATSAAARHRAT